MRRAGDGVLGMAYMAHDKFLLCALFSLYGPFSSSMLGLVISTQPCFEIYGVSELVGMSSYLLIGFWYDRDGGRNAARRRPLVSTGVG